MRPGPFRRVDASQHQQLASGLADLERNTRDLQEAVMGIRMIPMSLVFNRFPRMLRWRHDKPMSEANTLDDLKELLRLYG